MKESPLWPVLIVLAIMFVVLVGPVVMTVLTYMECRETFSVMYCLWR